MAETTDTVVTETPGEKAAPTGKAAFAAARAEIRQRAQSQDQGPSEPAPEPDKPVEETPAQEPAKPADEPTAAGETEDALLTPQEVAKLSPKELNLYKKAQANYTQKTQKVAARAKELEKLVGYSQLIETLETDPDAALEILAQQRGLKLQRPDEPSTKAAAAPATSAELPEGWEFLKPLFDAYGKRVEAAVLAKIGGELQPIKEAQMTAMSNAVAAETNATLEAFTAKHPGWQKYEAKMVEIGQRFMPAQGANVTDTEWLEATLALAKQGETQADQTKAVIDKINAAAAASEPVDKGVDETRVDHVMPSGLEDSKKRFRAAAEAAKRGVRWTY